MATLFANENWEIDSNPFGGRVGLPPPVTANDPRIPAPFPDTVNVEMGLVLPNGAPAVATPSLEEEKKVKYGIYSTKGDDFVFAALDEDNDPTVSVKASADIIETILKPMLEAASHKIVNYAGMDYTEAINNQKVQPMRRRRSA